jgi:vacuolar-type H+-ATPase subunit E/Vma4
VSVEAIVRVVEAESVAEAERILATARTRAADLVAAAEAEATARVREACERAAPGYRAEGMRRLNAVRVRRLERRASRSAELVDAAAHEAGDRLAAIAADPGDRRWQAALARLVEETAGLVGPGGTLRVRPVDVSTARVAAERLGCRVEPFGAGGEAGGEGTGEGAGDGAPPGVVGRSADGRIEVDATLPVRLARAQVDLAGRIASLVEAEV